MSGRAPTGSDHEQGHVAMPASTNYAQGWGDMSTGSWLRPAPPPTTPPPPGLETISAGTAKPQGGTYHAETRLRDGRPALLVDPGAVGHLSGDKWVQRQAQLSIQHGIKPIQTKRGRALDVGGVGQGKRTCRYNCCTPIALRRTDGSYSGGKYETPTVTNREFPALLGLTSLRQGRCIIDLNSLRLH